MHTELGFLILHDRHHLYISSDCYKHVQNQDNSLKKMSVVDLGRRTPRASNQKNVYVPDLCGTDGKKSYSYSGPVAWNALSTEYKDIEMINAFKKALFRKFLR